MLETHSGVQNTLKVEPEARTRCLRCKTIDLGELASPEGISFFECPECHRNYARKPGGALFFRWPHPIGLFLYPVIFEANPPQHCERVAEMFGRQESSERIEQIVREIRLELDDPTQQIRDILNCDASEEELRKYLRCLADRLVRSA